MENKKNLKPCPFCGKTEHLSEVVSKFDGHRIRCAWCGGTTYWKDSTAQAKRAWNRRADNGRE